MLKNGLKRFKKYVFSPFDNKETHWNHDINLLKLEININLDELNNNLVFDWFYDYYPL